MHVNIFICAKNFLDHIIATDIGDLGMHLASHLAHQIISYVSNQQAGLKQSNPVSRQV